MWHRPDGPYNWIGHYMDHWSKIISTHVQVCRGSGCQSLHHLAFFSRIMLRSSWTQFKDWPGEVAMVNGQAHHPQSQGLVERANAKVEQILVCIILNSAPSADSPWTLWLPEIQCKHLLRHIYYNYYHLSIL